MSHSRTRKLNPSNTPLSRRTLGISDQRMALFRTAENRKRVAALRLESSETESIAKAHNPPRKDSPVEANISQRSMVETAVLVGSLSIRKNRILARKGFASSIRRFSTGGKLSFFEPRSTEAVGGTRQIPGKG